MRNRLTNIISLLKGVAALALAGSVLGLTAPAYAIAPTATARPAPVTVAITPALAQPHVYRWFYYATYSTNHACLVAGSYQQLYVNTGYIYKCVKATVGDYFVYRLYLGIAA